MLMLIVGVILIIIGFISLYKGKLSKQFYQKIKNGKIKDYKKIVGTVICDAYSIDSATDLIKPVTPIVEYKVNGETYETTNPILETGAELPVGTKVYVWYKKDNPKQAILGTELESHSFSKLLGILLIAFGIIFLIVEI